MPLFTSIHHMQEKPSFERWPMWPITLGWNLTDRSISHPATASFLFLLEGYCHQQALAAAWVWLSLASRHPEFLFIYFFIAVTRLNVSSSATDVVDLWFIVHLEKTHAVCLGLCVCACVCVWKREGEWERVRHCLKSERQLEERTTEYWEQNMCYCWSCPKNGGILYSTKTLKYVLQIHEMSLQNNSSDYTCAFVVVDIWKTFCIINRYGATSGEDAAYQGLYISWSQPLWISAVLLLFSQRLLWFFLTLCKHNIKSLEMLICYNDTVVSEKTCNCSQAFEGCSYCFLSLYYLEVFFSPLNLNLIRLHFRNNSNPAFKSPANIINLQHLQIYSIEEISAWIDGRRT